MNNITIQDLFGLSFLNSGLSLGSDDPRLIVARLINVALGFLGIITLLMFLSAGTRWMLSGGDEEKVGKARGSMISTIIGLVIILSANSIVIFLMNAFVAK
ncbi:MAG TPA: hypothetical protein DEB09_04345 [Candidatus Magasanikbacteria bacterium]|nr:hypothetical protein [Candidatus Magasanikbacteria bacterium]